MQLSTTKQCYLLLACLATKEGRSETRDFYHFIYPVFDESLAKMALGLPHTSAELTTSEDFRAVSRLAKKTYLDLNTYGVGQN